MSAETYTYSPKKLIASNLPAIITVPGTLLSGQNLEAGTILAQNADGKLVAHPGNVTQFVAATSGGAVTVGIDTTVPVAGILMQATNASTGTVNNAGNTVPAGTTGDKPVNIYKAGNFWADQLVYKQNGNGSAAGADMAATSTNILKQKLFNGSMIVLRFQETGEV